MKNKVLLTSEIAGQKGVYCLLSKMYEKKDVVKTSELDQMIKEIGVSNNLFSELTKQGFFIAIPDGFYISSLGAKVTLLLKAINGEESISEIYRKLNELCPELGSYELITENVTDYFVDSICARPEFIRLYICSPWIRLDDGQLAKMKSAVVNASRLYKNLQIFVISKPRSGYNNWNASIPAFRAFKEMGADITTLLKLHTKLYICEPGPYGGTYYAIIGSENLTGRRRIELAIKVVNDNTILGNLKQYLFEIREDARIFEEV